MIDYDQRPYETTARPPMILHAEPASTPRQRSVNILRTILTDTGTGAATFYALGRVAGYLVIPYLAARRHRRQHEQDERRRPKGRRPPPAHAP